MKLSNLGPQSELGMVGWGAKDGDQSFLRGPGLVREGKKGLSLSQGSVRVQRP